MGKGVIYMTYGQMMTDLMKKFGVESREVLTFRLMWISYKSKGKVTYAQMKEYYEKIMRKTLDK